VKELYEISQIIQFLTYFNTTEPNLLKHFERKVGKVLGKKMNEGQLYSVKFSLVRYIRHLALFSKEYDNGKVISLLDHLFNEQFRQILTVEDYTTLHMSLQLIENAPPLLLTKLESFLGNLERDTVVSKF